MQKDAEAASKEDEQRRKDAETINEADAIVYSTEKLYADIEGKVKAESLDAVKKEVETLKALLENEKRDIPAISKQLETVTKVVQAATTELYSQVKTESPEGGHDSKPRE